MAYIFLSPTLPFLAFTVCKETGNTILKYRFQYPHSTPTVSPLYPTVPPQYPHASAFILSEYCIRRSFKLKDTYTSTTKRSAPISYLIGFYFCVFLQKIRFMTNFYINQEIW